MEFAFVELQPYLNNIINRRQTTANMNMFSIKKLLLKNYRRKKKIEEEKVKNEENW